MEDDLQGEVDVAVAAYRDEGGWQLTRLPAGVTGDIEEVERALRPFPSECGVIGMVAVDEDFFVLVRVWGRSTLLLLSDITAVDEWPLASSVADELDLPDPEDDDEPQPAGDMEILADLGVSAIDLAVMLDDPDAYPDEVLGDIAERLGFGDAYQALAG
ncbi:tRNA adenosine deaminase-associated protein [Mumia sp. zg.B21]|uniref:tRNA adenosine deaminase-associated protein n=1 Tax=unclassified Mumia TaxID=2621872 RepID=UPI001C6E50B2|nr:MULTISPECIES: tRNA adenosine deaminase-associated protein [unclassified Mumia]MBW9210172.1 tRNA adenosine deaminase-associated protein [Mumia sp. zg.B21]MDD9348370.1 tRNA adenosine deaminase-associated protein [Mumia sp.]